MLQNLFLYLSLIRPKRLHTNPVYPHLLLLPTLLYLYRNYCLVLLK